MAVLKKKRESRARAASDASRTTEQSRSDSTAGKGKKLRPNERLRSVLKESTFGAAVEALEKNVRFRLLPDAEGNARWLALLLHAESIGGLSEKTKRDEAKGSLVQQIVSDQIEAISTEEMLDREFFALVPSASTLERMGEYSMLTSAQYYWVVFSARDGQLQFDQNVGPATYQQALEIQSGSAAREVIEVEDAQTWARIAAGGVASEVADEGELQAESAEAPGADDDDEVFGAVASTTGPTETIATEVSEADLDGPDDEADVYASLAEAEDFTDEESLDPLDDADDDLDFEVDPGQGVGDADGEDVPVASAYSSEAGADPAVEAPRDSYAQYLEKTKDVEFTPDEVRQSLARRFLSDDLDLTVEMHEFDLAFEAGAVPAVAVPTLVPEGTTDWLGFQIAQMAEAANAELKTLHTRHGDELRQLYIDFTSRHIQTVLENVSVGNPDTEFGKMMQLADRDRADAKSGAHSKITSLRQQVEARFLAEADKAAEAAAAQARLTHMQVNRGRRDTALAQVEHDVTAGIEERYENERQQVYRVRRAAADVSLQQGKTLIFQALAEERLKQSDREEELLREWNGKILELVDENRKSDIARAEALAENLARTNAVDEERARTAERIEQLRAEHAERLQELEQRANEIRQDAIDELKRQDAEWERKLGVAEERTATSNHLVEELQTQLTDVSIAIRQQYEDRIKTLETSKQAFADELELNAASSSRLHKVLILLMVILVVAGLAIGGIAGWVLAQSGAIDLAVAVDIAGTAIPET